MKTIMHSTTYEKIMTPQGNAKRSLTLKAFISKYRTDHWRLPLATTVPVLFTLMLYAQAAIRAYKY